jgi:trimethylamine--corrinoid protein Co-methyltransferase
MTQHSLNSNSAHQPSIKIPTYEITSQESIEIIHQQSLKILRELGMAFYDQQARNLLAQHGARVDGELVFFEPDMVEEFISKAPSQFTQISRNPERSLKIGGQNTVFAPVYGPPFVYDLKNGRRPATIEDFKNFVKLAYLNRYIHHSGGTVVEPNDLPVKTRHLDMLQAHIVYSDKPFMGSVTSPENARDSIEMVRILYGEKAISDNPALLSLININSPRQFDGGMVGALREYAAANQATLITPFILAGIMSPVTVAGALAQQNAEVLAGIVYAQAVKPGAPVIYGSFMTGVDMQNGALAFGSPESLIGLLASASLARKYHLPFRSGGMFASSKLTDAQAGYESIMTLLPAVLGRVNFVLHAAGWLENGMTAGYEKFLLDCDFLGTMHSLVKGLDVSEESLAMDTIKETLPGEHFLDSNHTLRNYRSATYRFDLMDHNDFEQWERQGSLDSAQRASQRVDELLETYQPPELDQGIQESLESYILRRKQELEG